MPNKTKFDGSEGEWVSASEASKYQEAYLKKRAQENAKEPIRAQFFGKDLLMKMLNTEGAMGIRFYHGLTEDGEPNLVLVPTGADMVNLVSDRSGLKDSAADDDHGSNGPKCPRMC